MRKIALFLASCWMSILAFGQQVPREMVVVEVGTGTWCQYCPGAAMGCDDLIANGYQVAVIKYHSGDSYANVYSNARVSYYGVPGFPTAYFDGLNAVVGGSNTQSMFPQYSVKVNQRMAVMSSFTIGLDGTHQCLSDFTANITVNKVATNNSTNLRLHAVLTETHIPQVWQGMTEVNYATRLMIPNQNGTVVSFASGNTQTFNLQFSLDPDWVFEECELVVFLQDNATKEIFQATKLSLTEFVPEMSLDATVKQIFNLPVASCTGVINPEVQIRNIGAENLSAMDIFYQINNGELHMHSWTGSLDYLESEIVVLPPLSFTGEESNDLLVYTSNPNGNTDECTGNDDFTAIIPGGTHTPNTVKMLINTDIHPEETTWELKNSDGEVLYSGGPYTTSGQMVQATFDLTEEACYSFTIYDAGGDGLKAPGFVILYHGTNTVIYQGVGFDDEEIVDFNTADPVGLDESVMIPQVQIYPNPVSDKATLSLNLEKSAVVNYQVSTVTGQTIIHSGPLPLDAGQHQFFIETNHLNPGLYLYRVRIDEANYSGKLTVK